MLYEDFLKQYSLLLRGQAHQHSSSHKEENKENELLFEPLDLLYKKQLEFTPRRRSATPKRTLRRRAGESTCTGVYKCIFYGIKFLKNRS